MAFDIEAARKAGYTDEEIQQYLSSNDESEGKPLENIAPIIGSLLGGAAGGVVGAPLGPIGAFGGAVAGAGVGSAGGYSLSNILNRIRETGNPIEPTPDETLEGEVKNQAGAFTMGAGSEAVGLPLAKGLGYAAHPIKAVLENMVDKPLAQSAARINLPEMLWGAKNKLIPEFEKKFYGSAAKEAWENLVKDVKEGARHYVEADPSDIISETIPIKGINDMKRNLTGGVKKFGENTRNIDNEMRKALAAFFRQTVEEEGPDIARTGNKIASTMYKVPNAVQAVGRALPFQAGKIIELLGGVSQGVRDTVVPYGGGYMKKAIPGLLQYFQQNQ